MSNIVKLGSALPGDIELNGLDSQAQALRDNPLVVRAAIVTYTVEKFTEKPKDGIKVPIIGIRRFEPVGTEDELSEAVTKALLDAAGERTGAAPLPFDTTEVKDYTSTTNLGDDD